MCVIKKSIKTNNVDSMCATFYIKFVYLAMHRNNRHTCWGKKKLICSEMY